MNNLEKKNTMVLTIVAVVTLIVAVAGATFAYFGSFTSNVANKVSVNTTTEAASSSTFYSQTASITMTVPSNQMVKGAGTSLVQAATESGNLNVTLTSAAGATTTTTCTYDIYYANTGTTIYGTAPTAQVVAKEFTYTLTAANDSGITLTKTGEQDYIDFVGSKTTPVKVGEGTISAKGVSVTKTMGITLKFYNMPNTDQTSLAGKSFAGEFYVANPSCTSA